MTTAVAVKRLSWNFKRMGEGGVFPGGPVVKNPPAKAGDMGSIPAQGN